MLDREKRKGRKVLQELETPKKTKELSLRREISDEAVEFYFLVKWCHLYNNETDFPLRLRYQS